MLFLGRLGERKGVPELLEALSRPDVRAEAWTAVLAGDGDVDLYKAEVARLELSDRVSLPGWMSLEAASQLLQEADVFVLPSHAEGLPVAILDAFAYGVPVISTPVGAIPEALRDGANGVIVPAGDVSALASALRSLLRDEALRTKLGTSARATWSNSYSVTRFTEALAVVWDELLADRASAPGEHA